MRCTTSPGSSSCRSTRSTSWSPHATRPTTPDATTLLLLPDLLAYWLTGDRVAERTNASTTQFLDATTREWALPLLERLGLRTDLLPPLIDAGEVDRHLAARGR